MSAHRLIFGSATPTGNSVLAKWAAGYMPHVDDAPEFPFGPCQCVGIAREGERGLLAVVVFHDFQPQYRTTQISMASRTPLWAKPTTVARLLAIPFETFGSELVWCVIPHTNERALRFNKGIGMKRAPGDLRHMFGPGIHAVHVSMTRKEWAAKWKGKVDGQEQRAVAA